MVVHVYAADCTIEAGCVAFSGSSFDPTQHSGQPVDVPPEPSFWSGYRTNVKNLCGTMNIISPTTAQVSLLTSPWLSLSPSLCLCPSLSLS
jgi:hypothetical protein